MIAAPEPDAPDHTQHASSIIDAFAIAHRLILDEADTEFDRGVRRFGYLLTVAMLTMVLVCSSRTWCGDARRSKCCSSLWPLPWV